MSKTRAQIIADQQAKKASVTQEVSQKNHLHGLLQALVIGGNFTALELKVANLKSKAVNFDFNQAINFSEHLDPDSLKSGDLGILNKEGYRLLDFVYFIAKKFMVGGAQLGGTSAEKEQQAQKLLTLFRSAGATAFIDENREFDEDEARALTNFIDAGVIRISMNNPALEEKGVLSKARDQVPSNCDALNEQIKASGIRRNNVVPPLANRPTLEEKAEVPVGSMTVKQKANMLFGGVVEAKTKTKTKDPEVGRKTQGKDPRSPKN